MFGSRQGFSGSADRMTLFSGWIKSKMAADGHLAMTALSRVVLASAGLSCTYIHTDLFTYNSSKLMTFCAYSPFNHTFFLATVK